MKFNIIFSLLTTCACLATSPSFAMFGEDVETENVTQAQPSLLENQLKNVSKFVAQRKSEALPIKDGFWGS